MNPTSQQDRGRKGAGVARQRRALRRKLTLIAEVASVLTALAALIGWLGGFFDGAPSGSPDQASGAPSATVQPTSRPPATGPSTGTAGAGTYLDSFTPTAGAANRLPLPRVLDGQPGYDRPVVIACPTNQTTDRAREVVYELRNRFRTFTATVRPYRDPADGVPVIVTVFSDAADRLPGAPPAVPPRQLQMVMGESRPLSVPIEAAYFLRLRVECQQPDGVVILTAAVVS